MNDQTTEPADFVSLCHRAFAEFGVSTFWSSKPLPDPTPADALAITHSLRVEGDLNARRLAEQIERACRAAIYYRFTKTYPYVLGSCYARLMA
jgi:hypothetical protein